MRQALIRHVGSWLFYFWMWVREEYLRVLASWEGSIHREPLAAGSVAAGASPKGALAGR